MRPEEGIMFCSQCGTPNDDSAKFCLKCGARLTAGAPTPTPPRPEADPRVRGGQPSVAVGPRQFATGKNPAVALVLSLLIAGVGQFYNGDMKKGAIMLAVAIVGGILTAGLGYLARMVWSMVEAY